MEPYLEVLAKSQLLSIDILPVKIKRVLPVVLLTTKSFFVLQLPFKQ